VIQVEARDDFCSLDTRQSMKALFPMLAVDVGFIVLIFSARGFLVSGHPASRQRRHGKAKHL
jgi:hypothetical protein